MEVCDFWHIEGNSVHPKYAQRGRLCKYSGSDKIRWCHFCGYIRMFCVDKDNNNKKIMLTMIITQSSS
jgi:hypothetical protein